MPGASPTINRCAPASPKGATGRAWYSGYFAAVASRNADSRVHALQSGSNFSKLFFDIQVFGETVLGIDTRDRARNRCRQRAEGNILRGQPARLNRRRLQPRAGNYLIIYLYLTEFVIINITNTGQNLASNRFDRHVTHMHNARDVLHRPVSA